MVTILDESTYQWSNGIIVLLDALGTKTLEQKPGTEQFIDNIKKLYESTKTKARGYFAAYNKKWEASIPEITIFNDTVILHTDKGNMNVAHYLTAVGYFVAMFTVDSIKKGIYFRGAISHGDFLFHDDPTAVLGEAVYDAAKYFEIADWFGTILTQRTWDLYASDPVSNSDWGERIFLEYDVPIKLGVVLRIGALAWPIHFEDKNDFNTEISKGICVGSKLRNSVKFLEYYITNFEKNLKDHNLNNPSFPFYKP